LTSAITRLRADWVTATGAEEPRLIAVPALDWPDAEEALETLGIGYLANRYSLRLADGVGRRVRVGEVSASGIVVVADDFGSASAIGAKPESFELPFPAPERACGRSTDPR
jgi:hypothetical protein